MATEMTNRELIALLSTFDGDLPIKINVAYADEIYSKFRVWLESDGNCQWKAISLEIDSADELDTGN